MTDMTQGLFSIAAAIVGALGAASFALWLTLRKIRIERAFDRRLMWCEDMMRAINAAGAAVTSASSGLDESGREACWTHTIRLYEKLIPLCGLKEMYAPREAIVAINSFMDELATLIRLHLDGHCQRSSTVDCQPCLAKLQSTATSLARIGRGHLRLEPLPETSPSGRFLGSFRGQKLGEHNAAFSDVAVENDIGRERGKVVS